MTPAGTPGFLPPAVADPPCPGGGCDPAGIVGNEYRRGHPHASTVVCWSPEHQAEARRWVNAVTGEDGIFALFSRSA